MNIATYKAAIKTWVESQVPVVVPAIKFQWRDEAGGWQGKTRIRGHLHSSIQRGQDHLGYLQDLGEPAGTDFVPTVRGNREILLRLEATSRDQDGSGVALFHLEKLRTSLRKPSVRAALYTGGLAHATSEAVVDLDAIVDDRTESKAQLDIRFNAVVNERDLTEAGSFVETAGVAATLTDPAGNDVGWPEEEMP